MEVIHEAIQDYKTWTARGIVEDTDLSITTVRRVLDGMVEQGLISRRAKGGALVYSHDKPVPIPEENPRKRPTVPPREGGVPSTDNEPMERRCVRVLERFEDVEQFTISDVMTSFGWAYWATQETLRRLCSLGYLRVIRPRGNLNFYVHDHPKDTDLARFQRGVGR